MDNEYSFFGTEEEMVTSTEKQVIDSNNNDLIAIRQQHLDKLDMDTMSEFQKKPVGKTEHSLKGEITQARIYTKEEIFSEVVAYFRGDELAADVWIDKYALKNDKGELMERTPADMHLRMAKEFARIEKKYANPMSEELIFSLFDRFKFIIPQGSPMAGIGNDFQISSLSNCFVIGNEDNSDSYGGIMKMDEEQVQLMKRRGGVGHDLSHIRPAGSSVKNCAITSTGVVPFMERYSNSTREVAQDGRRGALMLSISVKHPDAESFIDAKKKKNKVTGANVSVKIDDEFMQAVKNGTPYMQQYPINSDTPKVVKEIDASKIWNKIIHNAWKSAEPGILFWDTICSESIPDCYADEGFKTVSTNPCGEIPLCPYDSCRLIALNLYSYVENPYTDKATFNMKLFKEHAQYAQRLMDDIIDLELEKIDRILAKIEADSESENVKRVEMELWNKIKKQSLKGRRTGLGITAEGDMMAALNIRYASEHGIAFSTEVHKQLALAAYRSSVAMAGERGAFPIYSNMKEYKNPFILRLKEADPQLYEDMVRHGRRNIALLTIAPTGSVSICTQTTSGIEPVFNVIYKRKRKVNPNDIRDESRETERDESDGELYEIYYVFHSKFVYWSEQVAGVSEEKLKKMKFKELQQLFEQSPYYKSTSADIDYVKKVEMQGAVQKWVDHSISVTVNMPENVTENIIADVYKKAWEVGCKGITVYRENSRNNIYDSIKSEEKKDDVPLKRPMELQAEIIRFKNNSEDWIAFIGIKDNRPYEIFTGKIDDGRFNIPKMITKGTIIKVKRENNTKSYDFQYFDRDGYKVLICGLSRSFNPEYWNYAKMISAMLRYEIPLPNIIRLIMQLNFSDENINSWKNGVLRALKKFLEDGTRIPKLKCSNCGSVDTIEIKENCATCSKCGDSKCGGNH
ncbi:MAG: adenosylcobalamin-dependent ribonucleoside-diphosphate reductase [Bacteroidales bacterium]|jgi:ribonucleoside-diphosphate reductase alpha chain|nr:adenosylcobalamin-dependent ribonucleoside-diphosphate reductase [Bacteroidales bacterium]